jgi:predicted nucleic acid-binding protein
MLILIDTSVFARYINTSDSVHAETVSSVMAINDAGHSLIYTPQIEAELIAFATRSENGLGMSTDEIEPYLEKMQQSFDLRFPDPKTAHRVFRALRRELGITGIKIHDLRLVADAKVLGIPAILTRDVSDFNKARDARHIEVLRPTPAGFE